jgi:hypothetical protein
VGVGVGEIPSQDKLNEACPPEQNFQGMPKTLTKIGVLLKYFKKVKINAKNRQNVKFLNTNGV